MEGHRQRANGLQKEKIGANSIAANPRTKRVAVSFTAYATLEIDDCLFDFDYSRPSHGFVHSLNHAMKEVLLVAHAGVSAGELASSKAHRAAVAMQLCLSDAGLEAMACDRRTKQLYLFDAHSQRWLVTDACGTVLRWWRGERGEGGNGCENMGEADRLYVASATLPTPPDSQQRQPEHAQSSPLLTLFASYDVVRHGLHVIQLMQSASSPQCALTLSYLC